MATSGRWLAALMLLACIVQLCEGIKFPSLKSKTQEEKEEEKRLKAARTAYKRLFVWSDKLTREDILEGIKALDYYKDQFEYDLDIDELMDIQEPKEELCDNREYVVKLKNLVKDTKKRYRALHEWVNDAFQKQLELCNYGERFANKLEQFKTEHEDQWKMVEDFNYFVGRHGARLYDWKGKYIDNTPQMNEALSEMFHDRVFHGHYAERRDRTFMAYNMARFLREACTGFADAVGATLLMNTFKPNIKQDEEKLEWLRYLNVCEQVQRVDFSKAVQKMFSDSGYLPGQEAWNSYLAYRELWV